MLERIRLYPGQCTIAHVEVDPTVMQEQLPWILGQGHVAPLQPRLEPDGLRNLVHPRGRCVRGPTQQHRRPQAGRGDDMVQHVRGHGAALVT